MIKKLTTTIPPERGPNPQGLNVPGKKDYSGFELGEKQCQK